MSEGGQIANIEKTINEIIAYCKNDPVKAEIARANFTILINAMKKYEKGPKYYNAIIEDADTPMMNQIQSNFQVPVEKRGESDSNKYPILAELEKIYQKKLKHKELQILGTKLSNLTGLKLDRDTKRSKPLLVNWFQTNWQILHSKIYEFELESINFTNPNSKQ